MANKLNGNVLLKQAYRLTVSDGDKTEEVTLTSNYRQKRLGEQRKQKSGLLVLIEPRFKTTLYKHNNQKRWT
ncbi:hypothetical protein [Pantoea sp. ACRSB]|uniref:hypothetical protein n=1 Tax=Pantoea sp. ACRSB TaxID=2918207 RepID=UPI002892A811|nr:hypothetical protein [Pantoea sp. ACRSB]MCG7389753.1 hypothetical protein [Pantoea sp. ACRSB]